MIESTSCVMRLKRRGNGASDRVSPISLSADEPHRGRLFYELLLVELEYRVGHSEHASRDDYMREFPQFAEQIEAAPFNHAVPGALWQRVSGNRWKPERHG